MKIVYACDDNYAALTAVSAVSLLKHKPGAEIILVGCRLKADAIETIKSRVEKFGGLFRYVTSAQKSTSCSPLAHARTSLMRFTREYSSESSSPT